MFHESQNIMYTFEISRVIILDERGENFKHLKLGGVKHMDASPMVPGQRMFLVFLYILSIGSNGH